MNPLGAAIHHGPPLIIPAKQFDSEHDSALTQILTRGTAMPVREVANNLRVEANHSMSFHPTHSSVSRKAC